MPLPLRRKCISVEFVTFLRSADRICLTYIRLFVSQDRFATAVTVFIDTDHRPVVHPLHRLEMHNTSVSADILKVEEPVFSGRSIHPCTLVRTVDWRVTLREYCFPFVRTVDVFRTQYDLPACRYPAGRMEDIIIVVSLIHFRTFASLMCFVTVEDNTRRSDRCICFRIQFADSDYTFQSGTTSCVCVYHIYFSVFIPERASVNDTFSRFHQDRFAPRTFRIFGFHHKSSLIGISPKDVKLTVVMTNSRSPDTITVFRSFRSFDRREGIGNCSTDDCPVD